MNSEKDTKKEIKNSILFENEEYNKALALKDEIINEKDETIKILTKQLGERDQVITSKIKEIDVEKSARIEAENQVVQQKELKVEHKGNYYRTEEEKFADSFEQE